MEEFREAVRKDYELIREELENVLHKIDNKPQFDPDYIGENENPIKKKKQEILNRIDTKIQSCEDGKIKGLKKAKQIINKHL
jgi:hypothetical protein